MTSDICFDDDPIAVVSTNEPPPRIARAPFLLATVLRAAATIEHGSIDAVLADGRKLRVTGRKDGPAAVMIAHDDRLWRDIALGGDLAFAEAYLDGRWDTPDLEALLRVAALNNQEFGSRVMGPALVRWMNRAWHVLRPNSRSGARRNIAAHYDLGNDFYSQWLDPTMTYSAARFDAGAKTLEAAQTDKYAALARMIGLGPGNSVLEVGCGWGGFAAFAGGEIGANVTSITISRAQYDFTRKRMFEAGLNEKVDVRLVDYRDVDGAYDRIASIEMFEAVGEAYWPTYFATLRDRLKPGGAAGIQVITIADRFFERYRSSADFIQRFVFPGGMLPSPGRLGQEFATAGLQPAGVETFGGDYARTLADWRVRFEDAWPGIAAHGFDDRFRRLWRYYLCYCEAGFRTGVVDVAQYALRRP